MKKRDYIRILMAPLSMLTVFACSPNQFQSSQEYDDVYFTTSDRVSKPTIVESTEEIESSNQKAFSLGDYSSESVDPMLVTKYSNSQNGEVVYYEEGPLVTKASELNYDDFVYDYENENLAYYELPLDWNTDWDKSSFNNLMVNDFQFQLAWYEQYYLNRDFRMNNYLSGRYSSRRNGISTPRVGLDIAFVSVGYSPIFFSGMTYVNLNRFGSFDPFWSPYYDPFWGYGGYYSPFYTSYNYGRPWGWSRWNRNPYYSNYYYTNNYYYNNEGNLVSRDGRDVTRGARISSTSVSSVRTDAVNGSTPNTRSSRYASELGARGSRAGGSIDGYQVVGGRNSSTAAVSGNTRSSRVNTNAYQFSNDSRLTRSNIVRSNNARSSRSQTYASSRSATSSRVTSGRNNSSSSNLFSRSSSTRSATPSYSRSTGSSRSSGVSNGRSSSSSSRGSGVSSGRSSSNSSRSSGVSSGRSSGNSSSSRSSGTVSSSSSRSGSASSSSSSSRSSSNNSSRSGRGN
ncbi:hypothetical protein [uncultured Roseivirga sp.]|uniref:hypothetical protein n=1 Tax=uncultured Roseivirga sp. TaxID=543088 RepID=UPI0030DB9131|tara:strand:- start:3782 stop:5317 length:1536 start_codon:yes stop_codon:yes gene_type:complete